MMAMMLEELNSVQRCLGVDLFKRGLDGNAKSPRVERTHSHAA